VALGEVARTAKVQLYYDSAHDFGAKSDKKYLGIFGDAEVFSLSATKTLACGEGGIITTDDDELAEDMRFRRNYGMQAGTLDLSRPGLNGKITEIAALLGVKGLNGVNDEVRARGWIAETYRKHLGGIAGLRFQTVQANTVSAYKEFPIIVDGSVFGRSRDELKGYYFIMELNHENTFPLHCMPVRCFTERNGKMRKQRKRYQKQFCACQSMAH